MKNLLFYLIALAILSSCGNPNSNVTREEKLKEKPYNKELVDAKTDMMTFPHLDHSYCYKRDGYYVSESLFRDSIVESVFNIIELKDGSTVEIVVNNDYWLVNKFNYFEKQSVGIEKSQILKTSDGYFTRNGKRVKSIECVGSSGFLFWDFDFTNPEKQNFIHYSYEKKEWKVFRGEAKKSFEKWTEDSDGLKNQYYPEVKRLRKIFNKIK